MSTLKLREDHSRPLHAAVSAFMGTAGQSTSGFNPQQAGLYMGLILEEAAEALEAVATGAVTSDRRNPLLELVGALQTFADGFKKGTYEHEMRRCDHRELVDAGFDTAWVSLGLVNSVSILPESAVAHGTFTNMDKFRDGICLKDSLTGKVIKPDGWAPPNFAPYVAEVDRTP